MMEVKRADIAEVYAGQLGEDIVQYRSGTLRGTEAD